jgi:hypothetical protein
MMDSDSEFNSLHDGPRSISRTYFRWLQEIIFSNRPSYGGTRNVKREFYFYEVCPGEMNDIFGWRIQFCTWWVSSMKPDRVWMNKKNYFLEHPHYACIWKLRRDFHFYQVCAGENNDSFWYSKLLNLSVVDRANAFWLFAWLLLLLCIQKIGFSLWVWEVASVTKEDWLVFHGLRSVFCAFVVIGSRYIASDWRSC